VPLLLQECMGQEYLACGVIYTNKFCHCWDFVLNLCQIDVEYSAIPPRAMISPMWILISWWLANDASTHNCAMCWQCEWKVFPKGTLWERTASIIILVWFINSCFVKTTAVGVSDVDLLYKNNSLAIIWWDTIDYLICVGTSHLLC